MKIQTREGYQLFDARFVILIVRLVPLAQLRRKRGPFSRGKRFRRPLGPQGQSSGQPPRSEAHAKRGRTEPVGETRGPSHFAGVSLRDALMT